MVVASRSDAPWRSFLGQARNMEEKKFVFQCQMVTSFKQLPSFLDLFLASPGNESWSGERRGRTASWVCLLACGGLRVPERAISESFSVITVVFETQHSCLKL